MVSKNNAEKDRPLAAPVLADLVADTHHIRPDRCLNVLNRRLDFRVLCDRRW